MIAVDRQPGTASRPFWATRAFTAPSLDRGTRIIEFTTSAAPEIALDATPSALEGQRKLPVESLLEAYSDARDHSAQYPDQQVVPSARTMTEALYLLELLPAGLSGPEPVIEASGTVALVWEARPNRFLALAVNGTGQLQRSASIDGTDVWGETPLAERLSDAEHQLLRHFRAEHA